MNKNHLEDFVSLSVGIIYKMKVNKEGLVQYEIAYKDCNGKEHRKWSDWMRLDGYKIGDSIPVKTMTVPGTCGLVSVMLEVNKHPQKRMEPYVGAIAITGICALIAGYNIGKNHRD